MEQTRIECETFDMLKSQEKSAVPRRLAVSLLLFFCLSLSD